MKRITVLLLMFAMFGFVFWQSAAGKNANQTTGSLVVKDASFAGDGVLFLNMLTYGERSTKILQTADGKLIVADSQDDDSGGSYFTLARLLTDGSLDKTFGNGGYATARTAVDYAIGAAQQSDGKILVVGSSFKPFSSIYTPQVVRFLPNGAVDTTFGSNGIVQLTLDGCAEFTAVSPLPDSKILVAGCLHDNEFALVRLLTDGMLDNTFGTNGVVTTPLGSSNRMAEMMIQPDGKIVLAGRMNLAARTVLVRYTEDGVLDSSFGDSGVVNVKATQWDAVQTAVLQPDGNVLLVGRGDLPTESSDLLLLRFLPSGEFDTTFGNDGIVLTDLGGQIGDSARAVALDTDGNIVVGAWTTAPIENFGIVSHNIMLLRYLADGSPDSSFGSGGRAAVPLSNGADIPHFLAFDPDGKLLLGGEQDSGTFVMRLVEIPVASQLFLPVAVK